MNAGGRILWEGASRLNGEPIVAIATGMVQASANQKTGEMVQTWVLPANTKPHEAVKNGDDASVCGDCIHRRVDGLGTCYVNAAWAPSRVWDAWRAGAYERASTADRAEIRAHHVRFGSFGDPLAAPGRTWRSILPEGPGQSTGYTHAWRLRRASGYRDFLMASCESAAEAEEARDRGWRPFLVVPLNRPVPEGFAWCPSDKLSPGKTVPCQDCGACSGTRGGSKSIAIFAHGQAASRLTSRPRLAMLSTGPNGESSSRTAEQVKFVRLAPDLHAEIKAHCQAAGVPMRRWVSQALRDRML